MSRSAAKNSKSSYLGCLITLVILVAIGFMVYRYIYILSIRLPDRPVFEEELPKPKVAKNPTPKPSPQAKASPKPKPSPSPKPTPTLPQGAYNGRVIWEEGLSVRSDPSYDSETIDGVEYNSEVIVLQTSEDGEWLKIRIGDSDREGWVRNGNIDKINP
jgi:uncharacterized protein YgiM (DUF1202 family)